MNISSNHKYFNILEVMIDEVFKPSHDQKVILNDKILSFLNKLSILEQHEHFINNVNINIKDSKNIGNETNPHFKRGHLGKIESSIHIFKNNNTKQPDLKLYIENNKKIQKEIKTKRSIANPFITFKSCVSGSIKDKIISEGLNIYGKELIIEITKRASYEWSKLNEEERAKYKKQALINKYHKNPPKILIDDYNDYNIKIENDKKDDYSTWVYNELLNVWVDTDNKLCYDKKDIHISPLGQLNLNKIRYFNKK